MQKISILITGGAGFIGSNLVNFFINDDRIKLVRVLDDLSTGNYENIKEFEQNSKFEFIKGDICNYETCIKATNGIDRVSHQAALGSVPRSIENPMRSTEVNILGTVNILYASVVNKVERVILACSSSTYGDNPGLPKVEDIIGTSLSPYAVTKLSIEQMAHVFHQTYGLNYIGLRYFNIFGPKQSPNNTYAAVIPLFCKSFLSNEQPLINGDGYTSRDFTYVDNAVFANELAIFTSNPKSINQIYNTACGTRVTLNDIIVLLNNFSKKQITATYTNERKGDIKYSEANISKITTLLNYYPKIHFEEGLIKTYLWYKSISKENK